MNVLQKFRRPVEEQPVLWATYVWQMVPVASCHWCVPALEFASVRQRSMPISRRASAVRI